VSRTAAVVGGGGQIVLGATICAGVVTCTVGGILIAHGANNVYEGVMGQDGPLRDAYRALLGDVGGQITYGAVDISTSLYGMVRGVLKPDAWKLFRYIPSDYEPALRQMTAAQVARDD
jgi:hypothetical protein